MTFPLEETTYGFKWGPLEVSRLVSDPQRGVVIEIKGDGGKRIEVFVSTKGQSVVAYAGDKTLKGERP